MASNDDNTTPSNPALSHQTLLTALQDLIVQVVDPKQKNDIDQIHLGPEAGKLITALQEFISSIITRSQPRAQNTITVSLREEKSRFDDADNDAEDGELSSKAGSLQNLTSSDSDKGKTKVNNVEHADTSAENSQPPIRQKLLEALREHVFNTMPIRLLCFEPQGESDFQITLLERGAIYAHLATTLEGNADDDELRPQMTRKRSRRRKGTGQEAIERIISKHTRYAILSHTWLRMASGEVTYSDWNKGRLEANDPGYQKLVNFCKTAWKDHHITLGWMDTVCINKESSSELDESIRSMYNWYSRSAVCITYLAETGRLSDMHADPWFTRGWTLQELLAPRVIKFYNADWNQLVDSSDNDKRDSTITEQIERATTITQAELNHVHEAPISRRMQLAATREVTREEDTSYSLMGLFDVSISTAYGEGARHAFSRLLQAILVSSFSVLEILNCAGEGPLPRPYNSRVLPSSPQEYINRSSNERLYLSGSPIEPLTISHMGLRISVILMPGRSKPDSTSQYKSIGDYNATAHILPIGFYSDIPTTYNLLDNRIAGRDGWTGWSGFELFQITIAVFNFTKSADMTILPKTCIGIGLVCDEDVGKVSSAGKLHAVGTKEPIVFELEKTGIVDEDEVDYGWAWCVKTDELAKHGMQLVSLYL